MRVHFTATPLFKATTRYQTKKALYESKALFTLHVIANGVKQSQIMINDVCHRIIYFMKQKNHL
jgi:hypothetical protein